MLASMKIVLFNLCNVIVLAGGDLIGNVDGMGEKVYNDLNNLYWVFVVVFVIGGLIWMVGQKGLGKSLMLASIGAYILFRLAPTLFEYLQGFLG